MATIINNSLFAEETGNLIQNAIYYVPEFSKKGPLSGGKMYFGLVGTDPAIESNQKKVYALQEDKSAYAMDQPIILSAGGVPQLNGNAVSLAIVGSYSQKVLNKDNEQVYYYPSVEQANNQGFSGVIAEESQTVNGSQTLVFEKIEATTSSFYVSSSTDGLTFSGAFLKKDVDYTVDNSTTITLITSFNNGAVVLGREMDPTGQIIPVTDGSVGFFAFSLIANAKASDLQIGAAVTINGGTVLGDGKGGAKYLTVAGGTGTADDINFIDLNNGNQLQLIPNLNTFAAYSENTNVAPITSGTLVIDLSLGSAHTVLLTENVSDISFINVNQLAGKTITCTLKISQDGTGSRTFGWPATINWPNGTVPTIALAANSYNRVVFITDNAGVNWDGVVAGQVFS